MEVLPQVENIRIEPIKPSDEPTVICNEVDNYLVNKIHDHVEQYLDSIDIPLSTEEQYAHILHAYDNVIKECKKEYSQDNIDTIIIARHLGDELGLALEELGILEEVKLIYTNL